MCSSIASVINSALEFRCTLFYFLSDTTGDSSYISCNVSSPSLLWLRIFWNLPKLDSRNVVCCFITIRCQIKNGNILLLPSLFVSSSMKESRKFILSWNFPVLVTCKTSKICDKTNFVIIAADSTALTETAN